MLQGIGGRRLALYAEHPEQPDVQALLRALKKAGAKVTVLKGETGQDDGEWHGARYAGLVLVGDSASTLGADEPRLRQLVREMLVSEKPVAAYGSGVGLLLESGGCAGRSVAGASALERTVREGGGTLVKDAIAVDGPVLTARSDAGLDAFGAKIVGELTRQMDEREVDLMSDQSFPASDPPSTNPQSVGHVTREESDRPRA